MADVKDETAVTPMGDLIKGRTTGVPRILVIICAAIPIFLTLFHLYAGAFTGIDMQLQKVVFVTTILVGTFLLKPLGRKQWSDPLNRFFVVDALFSILAVAGCVYYMTNWFTGIDLRMGNANNADMVFATIITILVLEACRRSVGWALPIICILLLLQNSFGSHLPGYLYGPSMSWRWLSGMLYMGDQGLFGPVTRIMTSYIILFFILAAFLKVSGAGDMFIKIAFAVAGRYSGGPAKAAVVASMLFGMISGSPASDVAATGSFTIPMMKRLGYEPAWAASIETVASTGAAWTPPMMGATVFLLAEFLGMPYLYVCLAAIIPCLLYYSIIFIQIHLEALRLGLKGMSKEEVPKLGEALLRGWPVMVTVLVLIALLVRGYGLPFCAFYTVATMIVLSFLAKETRPKPMTWLLALENSGQIAVSIGGAVVAAGIIVMTFSNTALGDMFGQLLIEGTAGILPLALMGAALLSMILGMGLPGIAIYVTLYVTAIPALIEMGVQPLAAHLYCYIWGAIHAFTPPFAPAVFVSAPLAGAGFWRTSFLSMRLGIAAYLTPIVFVYAPALLGKGSVLEIAWMTGTTFIGFAALAVVLSNRFLCLTTIFERITFLAGGILLAIPGPITDLSGGSLLVLAIFYQHKKWRAQNAT